MKIASNTIIKDGMPFIGKVLEQVEPYMDEMFITLSEKSTDGTKEIVEAFAKKYPNKVILDTENVKDLGDLADVQQSQIDRATSDWILFMSDDEYWPRFQLEKIIRLLDRKEDILAYSVGVYQLLNYEYHDNSWRKKFFPRFFKREGARFIKRWPRELIADKDNQHLSWKKHEKVRRLPFPDYHF